MKQLLLSLAFLSLTSLAFAQKKIDYASVPALAKEAKEKGNVKLADSMSQDYINNYLFKLKREELYVKENLSFMGKFLGDERSKSFKFFTKESEKINAIMGDYWAQKKVMDFIDEKYLPRGDFKTIKKPDWNALEKLVEGKFGILGKEIATGQGMSYYANNQDWKNYGIWYQKYFEMGLKHPKYHVNNVSWMIFEHVDDPKILKFASDVMKYAIENLPYNDWQALDTYANLLYKTGQKKKAIEWEEKAVRLSNNDKEVVLTLEQMQRNERTWVETVVKP